MTDKERDEAIREIRWDVRFACVIVSLCLLWLACPPAAKASETMLVSDYDFTNQAWWDAPGRVDSFVKGSTRLTPFDLLSVKSAARESRLNVFVVIVKLEQENCLITGDYPASQHQARMDRAMGWGLGKKSRWGFEHQLSGGCAMLRRNYDAWRKGWKKKIHEARSDERWIIPENAATWSLYCYTPWFGVFENYGFPRKDKTTFLCEGNRAFVRIWKGWKPRWDASRK